MTVVLLGSEEIRKSLTPSLTKRLEKPIKVNVPYLQNLTSLGGIKDLVKVTNDSKNYNELVTLFHAAKEPTKKVLYAHNIIQVIVATAKPATEKVDTIIKSIIANLEKIPEAETMVHYLKNTRPSFIIANYQDLNEQTANLF